MGVDVGELDGWFRKEIYVRELRDTLLFESRAVRVNKW
jgi:hypothetical protein